MELDCFSVISTTRALFEIYHGKNPQAGLMRTLHVDLIFLYLYIYIYRLISDTKSSIMVPESETIFQIN